MKIQVKLRGRKEGVGANRVEFRAGVDPGEELVDLIFLRELRLMG